MMASEILFAANRVDMVYPGRPRLHGYIEYLVSTYRGQAGAKFVFRGARLEKIKCASILAYNFVQ